MLKVIGMRLKRLILGTFFILLLVLLCYNYVSNDNYRDHIVGDLLTDYSENQIAVSGEVTRIYNDGFEIYVFSNDKFYRIIADSKVSLGNDAYISGTLNSHNEIIANKIVITKGDEIIFVIFRSLFGAIMFLLIFGRYWKFNREKMLFLRKYSDFPDQKILKNPRRWGHQKSIVPERLGNAVHVKKSVFGVAKLVLQTSRFIILTAFSKIFKKILRRK